MQQTQQTCGQTSRRIRRLLVVGLCAAVGSLAAHAAEAATAPNAYYTTAQAERGKALYNQHCLHCHGGPAATSVKWPIGFWLAERYQFYGQRNFVPMATNKYPNVYYLFARIRDSMPGWGAETVSLQEKADIVAHLLAENGYPAGPRELTPDAPRMKAMWFVERGFEPLFNGSDFAGWKFVMGPNCRLAPAGCAKAEPGTTFRVEQGEFVTDGKIQGYAYTEKKYRDFTLRFDFKFVPPPDWEGDADGVTWWGDGGLMLFIDDDHIVWPRHMQVQMTVPELMRPFMLGGKGAVTRDDETLEERARRPLRAWNSAEVVSKKGVVTVSLNGVPVASVRDHSFNAAGHIGIESEGAEMRFRNIRIMAE